MAPFALLGKDSIQRGEKNLQAELLTTLPFWQGAT